MNGLDSMADIIPLPLLPWSPPWSVALVSALLVFAVWFLAARAKAVRQYEYDDAWKELRRLLKEGVQIDPDTLSRLARRALSEATHVAVDSMSTSELESMAKQIVDDPLRRVLISLSRFDKARYLDPTSIGQQQAEFSGALLAIIDERLK